MVVGVVFGLHCLLCECGFLCVFICNVCCVSASLFVFGLYVLVFVFNSGCVNIVLVVVYSVCYSVLLYVMDSNSLVICDILCGYAIVCVVFSMLCCLYYSVCVVLDAALRLVCYIVVLLSVCCGMMIYIVVSCSSCDIVMCYLICLLLCC